METNIISEAYEYQREAIENLCLMDKERTKFYSTLVVVPTGGGKTRIAVDYLRENVFNKGGKVLWLGERLRLLTQTYEKFQENKRGKKLAVKKFSSKDENYQNTRIEQDTDLIIITQQTLRAQLVYNEYKEYDNLKGWFKKDDTLTVIIDEAHHATGIAYQNILYKLKQLHRKKVFKNLHIVGLTATPKMRDDESKIEETFFHGVKTDAKGQKRVSSETSYAYEISIHNLVVNQVLSRPYLIHIKENGKNEFEKEDLMNKKILSVYKNGLRGVKVESQLPESKKDKEQRSKEFGQTIIFVESRIQALKLEKLFKDNGVESCGLAISIDKQLGDKAEKAGLKAYYQKKIEKPEKDLEDYTKGKLNVIISVDKLREGIDIPKTQTVFIANKKVNEIQYTQMVGRALRGSIAGGTLIAYIVTFGDDDFEKMLWEIPDSYLDKKDEVKKKKYLGERKDKDISPIVLVNEDKIDIKGKKEKLKHFKHATEERKVEKEEEEVEKAVIREILMKFGTEKSIPKGYYQFNRKYLLVWDEMESWISYVCKNIDKITNDKGVNKLLDGGKSYKNFKIKAKGIYGEGSELARKRGILSSESVRCEYLYQFWHFYRVVENGDKELFDKDLKYKSFKSLKKYRIQEILEKGIKYSNEEAIKIFLEQEWNNFGEEREELWINSEIFASYFLPRIKWLNDIIVEPEIEEEDNEEDDYFRVKLYREGRKRKSLCELLKDVIRLGDISDEKKSSKFVDVFGGTGTVTGSDERNV